MVTINMAVTVDTVDELIEALKSAGPNVASFYGEVRGLNGSAAAGAIRDAASTPAPVPSEEPTAEEPAGEPEPVYTMVQVREALAKVRDLRGGDGMRELLRKYDADKLAGVDPDKYPALMQSIQAVLKEAEQDAC